MSEQSDGSLLFVSDELGLLLLLKCSDTMLRFRTLLDVLGLKK